MKLEGRILRLIAVGSSVTANCQSCLEINAAKALENGANGQEVAEAIEVGRMVRQGAASKMDQFASCLSCIPSMTVNSQGGGCGCAASDR